MAKRSMPVFLLVLALSAGLVACARPRHPDTDALFLSTEGQLEVWEAVWSSVDEFFHAADYNGADWPSLKAEVAGRIRGGLSADRFAELMDETLALLKDAHTYYLDPQEAEAELRYRQDQNLTGVGLTAVRGMGDYAVVGVTFSGGPAALAGIKAHDRIHSIDGHPAIGRDGYPDLMRMRGYPGTELRLRVSSPGGPMRDLVLARARVDPAASIVKGTILNDTGGSRLGYILFASMAHPRAADLLREEFERISTGRPLDGLMLDLRINGGGDIGVLSSSLGLFMEGWYGGESSRSLSHGQRFKTSGAGIGNSRDVPLIILVGTETLSAAEIMAGMLRSTGRAVLVGERTSGDTAWSRGFELPGGALVVVGASTFILPNGGDPGWYGRGIEPDWQVEGSGWDEIEETRDPAIAKAVELLLGR